MDTAEFTRIVAIGLGRAILHLQRNDATPYRAALLHACLHSSVYDPQVEPTREQYLFELIALTGERDFYRDRILAALPEVRGAADAEQVFELARLFAAHGDDEARQRLYDTFAAHTGTDKPHGADQLVRLDGIAGLLVVADRLRLESDDHWYAQSLADIAAERDGEEATAAALAAAAVTNPRIAAFAAVVEEQNRALAASAAAGQRIRDAAVDHDQIRRLLKENGPGGARLLAQWARGAAHDELARAAADLLTEEDPRRLLPYLRLFRRQGFPLDPLLDHTRFLALARDPDPRIAAPALSALANIDHPDIRALAFELLATGRSLGARLLVGNYRDGDYPRLERALLAAEQRDEVHDLGFGLLDVVEAHPRHDAAGALLAFYERGPCLNCRGRAVKLLQALGALPAWMVAECRHDADLELREAMGDHHDAVPQGGPDPR